MIPLCDNRPITGIGDPYILADNGMYYLYATSAKDGFLVWQSHDLLTWESPSYCYRMGPRSFGDKKFWAPEVYKNGDRYFMYYTADWKGHDMEALRIGLAVSESPLGPFADVYDGKPMFDLGRGALDAHILTDDDGRKYLFFSSAGEDNVIDGEKYADVEVIRLSADMMRTEGEPARIIRCEEPYEKRNTDLHQYWAEGPSVVKHDGIYHLMYSVNFFASKDYSICVAESRHPEGPYAKRKDNPVLRCDEKISGPGHNSTFTDMNGQLQCVYHIHSDYERPSGNRMVCISPVSFRDGHLFIEEQ